VGQVVHSGASGARIIDTLFFKLRWDRYGFDKKCIRTRYAELLFLYPVGSLSHAVHSGASGHKSSTHNFSSLGGTGTDLTKSGSGHIKPNFGFRTRWDLRVT
jgi:hypothetical protein